MVVSTIFYFICMCVYIQGINSDKKRAATFFILVAVFFLSFAYQPLDTDDLTREYACLDKIRQYGWDFFWMGESKYYSGTMGVISSSKFEGLYITQILYYVFAKFPVYNFLPACVVTFQFLLEFKLLDKVAKKFDCTQKERVFLFAMFFLTRELRWMMTGIRNQLAFTIAVYIIYNEIVEHKNRVLSIIGLLLCGMIHQSAYIFLLVRLILFIPNKKIKSIIAVLCLFWSNLLEVLIGLVSKYAGIPIINALLWKITIYTQNDSGENNNIILRPYYAKMVGSNVALIIFALLTCFVFWRLYKSKTNITRNKKYSLKGGILVIDRNIQETIYVYLESDYALFILFITCITIGSNMYYWLYLRFAVVLQIGLFVLCAAIIYEYRVSDMYNKRDSYMLLGTVAILIKFAIMVLVSNTSFYFDLFGFYPR